jgi:hypothetical protein
MADLCAVLVQAVWDGMAYYAWGGWGEAWYVGVGETAWDAESMVLGQLVEAYGRLIPVRGVAVHVPARMRDGFPEVVELPPWSPGQTYHGACTAAYARVMREALV